MLRSGSEIGSGHDPRARITLEGEALLWLRVLLAMGEREREGSEEDQAPWVPDVRIIAPEK